MTEDLDEAVRLGEEARRGRGNVAGVFPDLRSHAGAQVAADGRATDWSDGSPELGEDVYEKGNTADLWRRLMTALSNIPPVRLVDGLGNAICVSHSASFSCAVIYGTVRRVQNQSKGCLERDLVQSTLYQAVGKYSMTCQIDFTEVLAAGYIRIRFNGPFAPEAGAKRGVNVRATQPVVWLPIRTPRL